MTGGGLISAWFRLYQECAAKERRVRMNQWHSSARQTSLLPHLAGDFSPVSGLVVLSLYANSRVGPALFSGRAAEAPPMWPAIAADGR